MIRTFLVDDHEIVRRGIGQLLSAEHDMEVVGEAGSVSQALARIAATLPDVAVLDLRLPDGNGVDLCREIRSKHPEVKCLILTAYDDDEALFSSVVAGASAYVLKDVRGTGLVDAVRAVAAGRSLLDPALKRRVVAEMKAPRDDDPRFDSLSLRERQILALIADGHSNREIGAQLTLAEKTVKNYVSTMLSKLGLERRTQAVTYQVERRGRRS